MGKIYLYNFGTSTVASLVWLLLELENQSKMENSQSIDMTNSNFHTTSNSKGLDFIDAQQMDSEIDLGNSETIIFNKNGGNGEMDNEIKKENQQIKENSLTLDSSEQQLQQTDTPPLSFTATSTSKLKQLGLHPLRTKWTLWFLQGKERTQGGNSSNDWLDRLKDVSTVDTVEDFWALYDNIRPPSALPMQSDYCFFKNGIKPVWEVPENKEGGRLIIQIDKGRMDCLDTFWLEVLLALIGEQFEKEDSDLICGAVCNIRQKGSKICLWTKNVEAEVSNKRIGHIMKQRCQNIIGGASVKVNYEEHIATQNKSSSAMKYRFYLP